MKTKTLAGWYYKHFKTRQWARQKALELYKEGEKKPYERLLNDIINDYCRIRVITTLSALGLGYYGFRAGYDGTAHLCAGYALAELLGKQIHNRILPKKFRSRTLESILEVCLPTLAKAVHEVSEMYNWFWSSGIFELKDIFYTTLGALVYHMVDMHYYHLYSQIKEASTVARLV